MLHTKQVVKKKSNNNQVIHCFHTITEYNTIFLAYNLKALTKVPEVNVPVSPKASIQQRLVMVFNKTHLLYVTQSPKELKKSAWFFHWSGA